MTDILNVTNHLVNPMTRPQGYVETLDADGAVGWALHASKGPALVRAFSGSVLAGEALADSPRPDVDVDAAEHGRPGGGFSLRFAHSLSAEEQDGLVLLAGDQLLPRLPALNLTRRAFPVFIVGSPRSGTSILAHALRRAGYAGFFEGNLLSLLVQLYQDVDRHYRDFGTANELVLTAHIDPGLLKARLSAVLRDAVEPLYAGRPWMDKTGNPEMIAAIPVLKVLWPDSVFIFAKRRAIENVVSRLRKFPSFDFAYHCRDWARNMSIWRQLRAAYPSLPVLEVDQHDIAAAPDTTAGAIGSFLRLQPECIPIMAQVFAEVRTEETQPGTATRTLTMTTTGWSEAEQQEFRALCGAEMAAFNYTEVETYNGA